jgi:hypothetical protein
MRVTRKPEGIDLGAGLVEIEHAHVEQLAQIIRALEENETALEAVAGEPKAVDQLAGVADGDVVPDHRLHLGDCQPGRRRSRSSTKLAISAKLIEALGAAPYGVGMVPVN